MIRKIAIAVLCCTALTSYAQNSTISPYSFFGIGDLRSGATIENQQMGGIGMYTDSIHISLQNPAAYGKLKLTTYTFGGSHREFRLETFDEQQRTSVTNMEYIGLAFPIGKKMGVGLGVKPRSSVGYALDAESIDENGDTVTNIFTGEGGINQTFLSVGLQILPNLHIGATLKYNFGLLESQRLQSVEGVQLGTIDSRESDITGFDFNYGLTYTPKIGEKYTLFTSARVNTQGNLESTNAQRIGSFDVNTGGEVEVVEVDLEALGLKNTELKIPTATSFGLGFGQDKKWFIGAEYTFQDFSSFENLLIDSENLEYTKASTMALGVYFIPDYASFTSYLKRVNYRAGLRYDQTGLMLNGKEIENFGITFGLGLPLGGAFSNLNLGFELGRRGTTAAGLIEESYFKFGIGLSLNDRWFQKRKIN
jgi:long-subunit fatty acid transport protein